MTATPHVTGSFSNFYENGPLYEAAMAQAMAENPLLIDQFMRMENFRIGPDNKPEQYARWRNLAGTALPSRVAEGASLPLSDVVQRYTRTLKAGKLALRMDYTDEAGRFSGADETLEMAMNQGINYQNAMRMRGAQVLNGAFTASPAGEFAETNCWDTKALCATDHPLISGTASNKGTAVLSQTALRDALKACQQFVDDRGNINPLRPKLLIVPPALEDTAVRLTESSNIAQITRALTANAGDPTRATDDGPNAINPLQRAGLRVLTIPEIGGATAASGDFNAGSDTAWFLVDPARSDARFYNLGLAPFTKAREGENLVAIWETWAYYAIGVGGWRWIYGSDGTV